MKTVNHEYYVSLEVAKLLKEAGFDWETKNRWDYCKPIDEWSLMNYPEEPRNWNSKYYNYDCSAPTLEVAQRWLKEVKNCYVSVVADCDSSGVFYTVRIIYYDTNNNYHMTYVWREKTGLERFKHRLIFNNYEEAKEAGIKKALEMINKGE